MKHKLFLYTVALCLCGSLSAQTLRRQKNIAYSGIPAGDYSGISRVSNHLYAVVSDKEPEGFHLFCIELNLRNGKLKKIKEVSSILHPTPEPRFRDMEGIAYFPPANTVFITGEADQRILEYTLEGERTGRELHIPQSFCTDSIIPNKGFESLTYNEETHRFWTTTEAPTQADCSGMESKILRLQSFTEDLLPAEQYTYQLDISRKATYEMQHSGKHKQVRDHVHGVSELLALNDGSLLVLEREALVTTRYFGSYCICKIYRVWPERYNNTDTTLAKQLVCQFKTRLSFTQLNFANYEGMCLGPLLEDGRQTLLLISDSQSRHGNRFYHLKDYIKVIIL